MRLGNGNESDSSAPTIRLATLAPHGSAPCAAAALLLPLHPGPRYAQPLSYLYS